MSLEGILAIVFGITTVLGIVVTVRLSKRKQFVWSYKTKKKIGLGSDAPPELKLTFNEKPVNDVYKTLLIFFNKGDEPIRRSDVERKVVIPFGQANILR